MISSNHPNEGSGEKASNNRFLMHWVPMIFGARILRVISLLGMEKDALAGLSKLSVWWIKLGIKLERIEPGKPQQNGRHERMHKTLKEETALPPRSSLEAQ